MDTIIIDIWLVVCHGMPTPLKNMKVSWDDDIRNMMGKIKFMFQTTNQIILVIDYHYQPLLTIINQY